MDEVAGKLRKQFIILGLIFLFLLGTIIYSNILHAPFVFDDRGIITENMRIMNFSDTISLISDNRFIGYLSFAFNYWLGGLHVFGYHLTNNIIHITNALLVYGFVHLILGVLEPKVSAFSKLFIPFSVAFLFIAHPIQTQAVTYISQRFTSLATMFYLISLICYLRARHSFESHSNKSYISGILSSKTTLFFYAVALISALLAMKTKEIAITIPVSILLCEMYFLKDKGNRKIKLIFLSPLILCLFIIPIGYLSSGNTLIAIAEKIDAFSRDTIEISRIDYAITQISVVVTYLRLLIFPYHQNFDYDYRIFRSLFVPEIIFSLILLIGICFVSIFAYRRAKLVSFGIVWFFLTLSVESSFIPIRDVINEHRLYLPSIGFFLAAVSAVDQVVSSRDRKAVVMVIVVLLCAVGTYNRNKIWKDPESLWEDVLVKTPNNARAYNNLGAILKEKGEYDKALVLFEKSLQSNNNYTAVYYNLGDIEYRRGHYEKALNYLNTALTGKRDRQLNIDILNKLGRTYGAMGQSGRAVEIYRRGLELSPSSIVLLNNLGVQYIKGKQIDEAIETYERAIKIREEAYLYLNLAEAYSQKGDLQRSNFLKEKAVELQQGK